MKDLLSADPLMMISRILAFVIAIPFHEASHAFVSYKLGDPTAKNLGRLTLNPIKHLDPWGLLAMLTIGIGWAKPVPIDPNYYKDRRGGMALTAAAGPLSNLLLAYLLMVIYGFGANIVNGIVLPQIVYSAFDVVLMLAYINVSLAVFNMLPIPPFDGSRIFGLVLPEELYFKVMKYERYMMFAVLALLWTGVLSNVLRSINSWLFEGIIWGIGWIDAIFKLFGA